MFQMKLSAHLTKFSKTVLKSRCHLFLAIKTLFGNSNMKNNFLNLFSMKIPCIYVQCKNLKYSYPSCTIQFFVSIRNTIYSFHWMVNTKKDEQSYQNVQLLIKKSTNVYCSSKLKTMYPNYKQKKQCIHATKAPHIHGRKKVSNKRNQVFCSLLS